MDNFLILERLDRLEGLITANREVPTFEETYDYIGISRSYLYKLTAAGHIPHSKPNGKLIFSKREKLSVGCYETDVNPRTKYRTRLRRVLREMQNYRLPLVELLLS